MIKRKFAINKAFDFVKGFIYHLLKEASK